MQVSAKPSPLPLYSLRSGRLLVAFLLMLAVYVAVSNRSHIGYGMVCMVNATAIRELDPPQLPSFMSNSSEGQYVEPKCRKLVSKRQQFAAAGMDDEGYKGTFLWPPEEQSILISAGFYGNLIIMCFSGYLADFYGPKRVAMIGVLGMSVTALISPTVAHWNYYAFVVVRVLCGIFENPVLPALGAIVARWFPANEKSSVAGLYTSGNQLSASLGVLIASQLCQLDFLNGWPLIFYLAGFLGVTWMILFYFIAEDDPADSRILSQTEKNYLHHELGQHHTSFAQLKEAGQHKLPLREMLLSKATIAVVIGQFSFNITNSLLQMYLPTYARDILYLNASQNGIMTSALFFVQLFSKNILANVADSLKQRKLLTPTQSAKLFQGISNFGGAISLVLLAFFADCTRFYFVFVVLCVFGFCFGGAIPGSFTCNLCIAPLYTGMIVSLTMVAGSLGNVISPTIVGFVVHYGTRDEWSLVFCIIAVGNVICGVAFLFLASAEVQPWAKLPQSTKTPIVGAPRIFDEHDIKERV